MSETLATAPAIAERRSPTVASAAGLFMGRELSVALSYKTAFVMNAASVALSLVMFHFIAKLVTATAAGATLPGGYFSFVVVGLATAQILDGAVTQPSSLVRQEQVQGTLEVLATTPLRPAALAAGWISYPIAASLVNSLIMLALAGPLGFRFEDPNWPVGVLALVLSSLAFAGFGILVAAVVLVIQQGAQLTRWISAGMGLLSGVFFPIELFPRWLQLIAQASPLSHAVEALRGSMLLRRSAADLAPDLIALGVMAALLIPLSLLALSAALARARARGTISSY
ncbi:MAG TPA: ABC transporter permease [Actinomycetota bacterium]|nr:ABC transporter permease [Actinomycetota bacterium]